MNSQLKTDIWIYHIELVLGSILVISVIGTITLLIMEHSLSEVLAALGSVSGAGLAKLRISPWNREL